MRVNITPEEQKERRREYQRTYMRKYRSISENRKKECRWRNAWKKKNHSYFTLQRTITQINECGDEVKRVRKNAVHRKWIGRMSQDEKAKFRKSQTKANREWYHKQCKDPEIGELFKMTKRPVSRTFTKEMRDAAIEQYKAIMVKRKEMRRAKRLEDLFTKMKGAEGE